MGISFKIREIKEENTYFSIDKWNFGYILSWKFELEINKENILSQFLIS